MHVSLKQLARWTGQPAFHLSLKVEIREMADDAGHGDIAVAPRAAKIEVEQVVLDILVPSNRHLQSVSISLRPISRTSRHLPSAYSPRTDAGPRPLQWPVSRPHTGSWTYPAIQQTNAVLYRACMYLHDRVYKSCSTPSCRRKDGLLPRDALRFVYIDTLMPYCLIAWWPYDRR